MNLKIKKINRVLRGWFIIIFFIIFIILLFMFMFIIVGGDSYQYCGGQKWFDDANNPCPYFSIIWKPDRDLMYLLLLIIFGGIIFLIFGSYFEHRSKEKEFKREKKKGKQIKNDNFKTL
ncbi:hypothetical protein LCGC14_1556400 [marine sediment metagenome]|uniref:Uncharacterized protein n=1 Tax=marine sediment metagenome TaxID=412755 RepID=A0A0F9INQ0_9ZZZZ